MHSFWLVPCGIKPNRSVWFLWVYVFVCVWAHVGEWGNFPNLSHLKHEMTLTPYECVTWVQSTNYKGVEEVLSLLWIATITLWHVHEVFTLWTAAEKSWNSWGRLNSLPWPVDSQKTNFDLEMLPGQTETEKKALDFLTQTSPPHQPTDTHQPHPVDIHTVLTPDLNTTTL